MDFQTLARRELQSLCKLNKIPANQTNVAMAEALQSLETVVGIEEYLNATQSETADVVQSGESVEVLSPKAPQTRCRTSTHQKVKPTETETLQSTVTRTTRRGSKQPPKEVEESKNDSLKTPAISRTTRKVPVTSTRRNVNNRLSECETEVKEEALVESKYSTRRSTRLTEKKSAAPRVKKGVEKAVKIDSILDQGNSNAVVEDICNAFEKLDVVVIEEEVSNLKQESDETSNTSEDSLKISEVMSGSSEEADPKIVEVEVNSLKQELEDDLKNSEVKDDEVCDLKPESEEETQFENENDASNPCEDESFAVEKIDAVIGQEEITESGNDVVFAGVDAELEVEDSPCADSEMCNEVAETNDSSIVASSMIMDNTENPINEIITKEMVQMSENTVDETTAMTEVGEDLKPVLFTENNMNEKSEAESGPTESPLLSSDVTGHLTHMTPIKKATPFKSMTEEVKDQRFEVFTENNGKSDVDVTPFKNASGVVSDDKENNLVLVKNLKKDENDNIKSANDMSIRQLKKLLKSMTLGSHNSKEEGEAVATKRTALQAVCENQMMVGGENEN